MNVKDENRPYLIAVRMQHWLDIARCPLVNIKVPTWRARKNYCALVRKYPEIAAALGYTEALSFPSPLHDLWSPVQQQVPPAPQQEFPTDVTDSSLGVPPRMVSLEDEIL